MNARVLSPHAMEVLHRWRSRSVIAESQRCLALRLSLMVWLMVAAAVSVRTLVRPSSHTVFPIFAASAEHWWGNRPLYEHYPGLDSFRYPPVFALFVTPFNALGLLTGGILWSWLSIAVLVVGLWQFARDVIPSAWTRQRIALFLMLGALGALRGLWNAQSNALIVGFLLLGSAALARAIAVDPSATTRPRLWWSAAVLLAVPCCLKLTPLAPVLLLVVLWPRGLGWRLPVVMATLFLLPFLSRPPDIVLNHYGEWIDHLMESGSVRWVGFRDGWTMWIVLRHLLGIESGNLSLCEPLDSRWYRLVQITTAAGVLGWCLWQRHRAARLGLGGRWLVHTTLSMGLAWLMLFGPAVEHATYVFLAPPLIWALLERGAWPLGRGLILGSFALIMVLGWGAVTRLLSPEWPVVLIALPAGTALFILWLLGYAATHPVSSSEPTAQARHNLAPLDERSDPGTARHLAA